ncbi:hypothetical protein FF100_16885 [Methylobacterium terricola]|uniref:Uncharacterized protein n=1 Tax=Methylobacterium terricola TaxID=2583531 RepID=A0A5C4LJR8_9HYPH|nr:hypothetical protein [Methylobacterium terricola]TNC12484.1 hypothetical protein FF100_16885 [Methylobacterium terricola]
MAASPTGPPKDVPKPGDRADPGTPGTSGNLRRRCSGTGLIADGPCPDLASTGTVTEPIGGA